MMDLEQAFDSLSEYLGPRGRELVLVPQEPGHSPKEIRAVELEIGWRLPESFRDAISRYNFVRAEAGSVSMSNASTLAEWLVLPNIDPVWPRGRWWTTNERPQSLLLIASSDAHVILLHRSGEILAACLDDPLRVPRRIASNFSLFYVGIVSVYIEELSDSEIAEMIERVGASRPSEFWSLLTTGDT